MSLSAETLERLPGTLGAWAWEPGTEAVVDHVPLGCLREEAEQAHAEEIDR